MTKIFSIAIAAAFMLLAPGLSAEEEPDANDFASRLAVRTDNGRFEGTWFYISRREKMALWIQTENGKPEAKIRYQSRVTPEAFETDWDGDASYYLSGLKAGFEIKIIEGDENTLRGSWNWDSPLPGFSHSETGKFKMYRATDGRMLVLVFEEYRRTERRGASLTTVDQPTSWAFRKLSKRIAPWDEITK